MLDEQMQDHPFSEEEGPEGLPSSPDRSLTEDIGALIDDGKTYVEAELAYQKSRLAFVANRSKSGIGFVLAAFGFLHLALIGLVVGGIFTLIPIMGAGFATLAVVGALLLGVVIFGVLAKQRFGKVGEAFREED